MSTRTETHEQQIERVARAICKATGNDPDWQIIAYETPRVMSGKARKIVVSPDHLKPAWTAYVVEAAAAIEELGE